MFIRYSRNIIKHVDTLVLNSISPVSLNLNGYFIPEVLYNKRSISHSIVGFHCAVLLASRSLHSTPVRCLAQHHPRKRLQDVSARHHSLVVSSSSPTNATNSQFLSVHRGDKHWYIGQLVESSLPHPGPYFSAFTRKAPAIGHQTTSSRMSLKRTPVTP